MRSLHHAYMAEYSKWYRPVDVLLVGGLNDAMRDRSAEDIIQDIQAFKVDVLSIHRDPDAGEKSSFAAATLPSPPKIAVLPMEERKIQDNQFE